MGAGIVHHGMRSVGGALRRAERVLARQARLNAWAAVCADRRHAAERDGGPATQHGPATRRSR